MGEKIKMTTSERLFALVAFSCKRERERENSSFFILRRCNLCGPVCGRRREAKVRRWKEKVNDIRKRAREREREKLKGKGGGVKMEVGGGVWWGWGWGV